MPNTEIKELELELAIAKEFNGEKREIEKLERLIADQTKPQPSKQNFMKSILTKLGVN